jgi:hypothetical protein
MANQSPGLLAIESVETIDPNEISLPDFQSTFFARSLRLEDDLGSGWTFPRYSVTWQPSADGPLMQQDTFVPLLSLHCPKLGGCKAKLSLAATAGVAGDNKVTIGVITAGVKLAVSVTMSRAWETDGSCVVLGFPATLSFEWGTVRVNDTPFVQCMRAILRNVDANSERLQVLTDAEDDCTTHNPKVADLSPWKMDLRSGGKGQTATSTYGAEISGEVSLGLTLGPAPLPALKALPLKLEFTDTASLKLSASIEYTVIGGHSYQLYVPDGSPKWQPLWKVSN